MHLLCLDEPPFALTSFLEIFHIIYQLIVQEFLELIDVKYCDINIEGSTQNFTKSSLQDFFFKFRKKNIFGTRILKTYSV